MTPRDTGTATNKDKPSKAEVEAGFTKLIRQAAVKDNVVINETTLKKLAACVVNKIYVKSSTTTLRALTSGDIRNKIPEKDGPDFVAANKACGKQFKSLR